MNATTQHHNGHEELWEATGLDCEQLAVAHSREAIAKRLESLGYVAPPVNVFGAQWTHPTKQSALVLHSRAYHRIDASCWVCERIERESTS